MFPVGPASTVDAGSLAGDFQSWSEMAGYRSHTHPLLRVDLAEQDVVRRRTFTEIYVEQTENAHPTRT